MVGLNQQSPWRSPRTGRPARSVIATRSVSLSWPVSRPVSNQASRSGALLLVVLLLLVVILLMGMSFLTSATTFSKTAKSNARLKGPSASTTTQLTDAVAYQLIRDTPAGHSSLNGHSLLGDLYGTDSLTARIQAIERNPPQGPFVRLQIATTNARSAGYYNGCVLAMLDGPSAGTVGRVVDYVPQPNGGALVEMVTLDARGSVLPTVGDSLVISGRPLNGTGHGYHVGTGKLNQTWRGKPIALLPHFARYSPNAAQAAIAVDAGGADESWDAVDYQNLFLARMPAQVTDTDPIIPSFHRPSLIRYWMTQDPTAWGELEFQRLIQLRPLQEDHPGFTGSNPRYDPVHGPWDVDNDGDGIGDSIWIDVGFPTMTTVDGKAYKPLAAILCVDLDGRLNLNAHGNEAQTLAAFYAELQPDPRIPELYLPQRLPRGMGYGPSEISLRSLFRTTDQYTAFLKSRYANRQGSEFIPGAVGDDLMSSLTRSGMPNAQSARLYASPSDVFGQRMTLLDLAGQPVFSGTLLPPSRESADDPYELSLLAPRSTDRRFTLDELESLLRRADADVPGGNRLLQLLASSPIPPLELSRIVTTHSSHISTPPTVAPAELRTGPGTSGAAGTQRFGATSVQELLHVKLMRNGITDPVALQQLTDVLLPFEFTKGEPLNINRPLGNGVDDGGAPGVVDDPRERKGTQHVVEWQQPVVAQYGNGQLGGNAGAPQILARHLYCLASLLINEGYRFPDEQNGASMRGDRARRIAQWAINVVDFRDPDAIMSPFEYDINPFNGWNVDGDLTTNQEPERGVVWGCEYPHLLLTESLAFHDLRLQDTDQEPAAASTIPATRHDPAPNTTPDDDLDQTRMPQGSAFIELYCTGNPHAKDQLPKELYSVDGDGTWKLDLGRVATTGGPQSPVWRLAVSSVHATPQNSVQQRLYQQELSLQPTQDGVPIERIVHFATSPLPASQQPAFTSSGGIFYNKHAMPSLLAPKHYAVVGSRPKTAIGSDADGRPSPNVIRLTGLAGNSVHVEQPKSQPYPQVSYDIKPSLGMVAAMDMEDARCEWSAEERAAIYPQGVGFNVSMPLPNSPLFYPAPATDTAVGKPSDTYDRPFDTPLDAEAGRPLSQVNLVTEGTRENFRTIYLQRLADPTVAFHPQNNPYLTVDWLPIDLTVFNGSEQQPPDWPPEESWIAEGAPESELHWASRERGLLSSENIWRAFSMAPGVAQERPVDSDDPEDSEDVEPTEAESEAEQAEAHFDHELKHSLGFLSRFYGRLYGVLPEYRGDSQMPFPWMTWLDRPYSNPFELLLVPSSSPARLLYECNLFANQNLYQPSPLTLHAPYGHLLNFYQSSHSDVAGTDFCRLLEFVGTPSPFSQTSTFLSPTLCATKDGFLPPFNRISKLRDPGRVNINTIHDARVWKAVCDDQVEWSQLQASRGLIEDPQLPTRYPQPFRAANSADLMPLAALEKPTAQATLLRATADDPSRPLFQTQTAEAYRSTEKNAYFRYQLLQQLGGRVTQHSHVFAVWITVGFFEVVPHEHGVDAMHPDGLTLSEELGMSLGNVRRHRAFYVIDRSVPVGYLPGKNVNVDSCILLRRTLE